MIEETRYRMIPDRATSMNDEDVKKAIRLYGDLFAFNEGRRVQYSIDGGDTVIKEMRKMILEQAKEWIMGNLWGYTNGDIYYENLCLDFCEAMNRLWEDEK